MFNFCVDQLSVHQSSDLLNCGAICTRRPAVYLSRLPSINHVLGPHQSLVDTQIESIEKVNSALPLLQHQWQPVTILIVQRSKAPLGQRVQFGRVTEGLLHW